MKLVDTPFGVIDVDEPTAGVELATRAAAAGTAAVRGVVAAVNHALAVIDATSSEVGDRFDIVVDPAAARRNLARALRDLADQVDASADAIT